MENSLSDTEWARKWASSSHLYNHQMAYVLLPHLEMVNWGRQFTERLSSSLEVRPHWSPGILAVWSPPLIKKRHLLFKNNDHREERAGFVGQAIGCFNNVILHAARIEALAPGTGLFRNPKRQTVIFNALTQLHVGLQGPHETPEIAQRTTQVYAP